MSAAALATASCMKPVTPSPSPWDADLSTIRRLAKETRGELPIQINVVKLAESHRTMNFSVEGAPAAPVIQSRTAYQVVYPDHTVMIDSGMDLEVHRQFGHGDTPEPYWPEKQQEVVDALMRAKSIVITHEHGDHIAGVLHSPMFEHLAPKTTVTSTQVHTLISTPQLPQIRLTSATAARLHVIDYPMYSAYAPGISLFKAPGHTPGLQVIYVVLQSGREYLFASDIAWQMEGIRQAKGKAAPWITEDKPMIMAEISWLHRLSLDAPEITIVISHDEDQRLQYIQNGTLGDGFV